MTSCEHTYSDGVCAVYATKVDKRSTESESRVITSARDNEKALDCRFRKREGSSALQPCGHQHYWLACSTK